VEVKKRIFIATPMYGAMCTGMYSRSVTDLVITLLQNGYEVRFQDLYNETIITKARNHLTEEFLRMNYDYLLFIDADQGFDPKGVLKMIEEDEDVFAGVVPLKKINWDGVAQAARMGKTDLENYTSIHNVIPLENKEYDFSQKIEVKNAGTGLLLVKRKVFEALKSKVSTYKFGSMEVLSLKKDEIIHNFWDTYTDEEGNSFGEDYNFCRLWREMGGKVYAAFWPRATHIGNYTYK
jgi:hypothetical protein